VASRRKLVVGNWKMHGSLSTASDLAWAICVGVGGNVWKGRDIEVVLCPVSAHLSALSGKLVNAVKLGAQNAHPADRGAFTGELSMSMLGELGCQYVIVGHSERRQLFAESNIAVAAKVKAALVAELTPILCVGETLAERQAGELEKVIHAQLSEVIARVGIDALANIVIAYEPVWAIGTGQTATPEQAQEVHAMIRTHIANMNAEVASGVQIIYGGSVKPENAADLFSQADIDGGLIGGAALDAHSFTAICQAAAAA